MMRYSTRDGRRFEEENGQDRLLRYLYHSRAGRGLIRLLTLPMVSKLGGRLLNTRLSAMAIPSFVRSNHIDLTQYEARKFTSYNDFFTRKIKPEQRPILEDARVLIAPCDGKASVYRIDADRRFAIKNSVYTVESLTRSHRLAEKYSGGWCILLRLTVDDYHRYCYPASGRKSRNVRIPGCFHTVNPTAVECAPVYKENTREYTLLRTEAFGDILQMEVGAMMVGRITNHHEKGRIVRGAEKGYFEFGGSTVILLVEPGRLIPDEDLVQNTADGYETIVKMGTSLGRSSTI